MSVQLRCAIYTRKSTEEGLEQGFNSLHAQREACEAFIRSQRHEGWRGLPDAFDDGRYSGGTMNRPALARLLESIRARQVDVVVVYKVDRLTRSLADFAKMVELFDASGVSFVSVTQQFNTTTSMGRLTLNVLLSFAQFEREVTGERIRDKIAASKQKGIWMGGLPPLGYDVQDRALVINPGEAEWVRTLFRLYAELGTVRQLKEAADRMGLRTKRRKDFSGRMVGGRPFSRGQLYRLLSNRLYVGQLSHKGTHHPGRHPPIIDRATFESVQVQLAQNAAHRKSARNGKEPSLLTGLVFDEISDRLCPTHANKNGRRYRYYVSTRLLNGASHGGWRLAAREIEAAVLQVLREFLLDTPRLAQVLERDQLPPEHLRRLIEKAAAAADEVGCAETERQHALVTALIDSVKLHPNSIQLQIKRSGLAAILADSSAARLTDGLVEIATAIQLKRRGVETKLVLLSAAGPRSRPDQTLINTIAKARLWMDELAAGRDPSMRALARRYGRDPGEVCRTIPLAFLAPDIIDAILGGCQPMELTPSKLKRISVLPTRWKAQRRTLLMPRGEAL